MKSIRSTLTVLLLSACLALPAAAHDIVRRSDSTLPIATSVRVPAGADWLLIGATLPRIGEAAAPPGSLDRLGDTAAQAADVLAQIETELDAQGFAMSDVVMMTVHLVGDPARNGRPDYAGLMAVYLRYFGKDRGGLPVRSTVQVAGLPVPGALVSIEVIAARGGDHDHD